MRTAGYAPRTAPHLATAGRGLSRVVLALAFTLAMCAPAGASTAEVAGPSPARAGSIGLRIVDVPAAELNDPRAHLYFVDQLAPGTVIHRHIEVDNTTASTRHVVLYAAAATIAHGTFIGSAARTPNDLSNWVSIAPATLDIISGGHATATVTMAIPRGAAPGEQYGVVWAEVRSQSSAKIVEVNRVGIRMYIAVGAGGAPAAAFTVDTLTARRTHDGEPVVVASVRNTGGRALDISGTLQLSAGPAGLRAGPFAANLGVTLAIGDTEPVTIPLDRQLPAGPWTARIALHSGLLEHDATATITFPERGAAHAVTVSTPSKRPGWFVPAIVALMALLVGSALRPGRRYRRRRRARTPAWS